MNIAFVLPYFADSFGGPVMVVKKVGTKLAAMGHNVSYWAAGDKQDQKELMSEEGIHIYDIQWPRSWRRSRDLATGLSAGVSSFDIMYITGMWLYPTYAACRIAAASKTPYILRPAGSLEPWRLRNTPWKCFKKKIYLNLIGKYLMHGAACLHACSMKEAEHFRQIGYRGSITVMPNGVDTDEFTPGDDSEVQLYWPQLKNRRVVLFMSRLSPEKGLDILIPLWAELMQSGRYKNAMLVIAGPDDRGYVKVIQSMIDKYGINSSVLLPGMVREQKKLTILRRADIFILPSYSENFGNVVVEALSCGTPVITTTGTPWKQLQEFDAGRCVSPTSPELSQALRELLDMSKAELSAMGKRGRDFINKYYTWDIAVRRISTVFSCVATGKDVPLQP
jgi:glycosyltransferase involved in cell wall biosynthesis